MFTRVKNVVSNSMFYRRWIVYKWFWLILAAGFLIWDPFGWCSYLSPAGDIVTAMKSTT
jgi:hypothetical protein